MTVLLKKFGTILTSRSDGREAFLGYQSTLQSSNTNEEIILDFTGVAVLSPGWADEFITPLSKTYGDRLRLAPVDNSSVDATLQILKIKLRQP